MCDVTHLGPAAESYSSASCKVPQGGVEPIGFVVLPDLDNLAAAGMMGCGQRPATAGETCQLPRPRDLEAQLNCAITWPANANGLSTLGATSVQTCDHASAVVFFVGLGFTSCGMYADSGAQQARTKDPAVAHSLS